MITPEIRKQILDALSNGATVGQAATDAGVHRSTIYTWMRTDPELSIALDRSRAALQTYSHDELQDISGLAISTIRDLLSNSDIPASLRLRAAQTVLKATGIAAPSPELRMRNEIENSLRTLPKFDNAVEKPHLLKAPSGPSGR